MGFALDLIEDALGSVAPSPPKKRPLPIRQSKNAVFRFPMLRPFSYSHEEPSSASFLRFDMDAAVGPKGPTAPVIKSVSPEWLVRVCEQFTLLHDSPFPGPELASSIVEALKKDDAESNLFNLLGFEGIELIQELLVARASIQAFSTRQLTRAAAVTSSTSPSRSPSNKSKKASSVSITSDLDQYVSKHARKEARRNQRRQGGGPIEEQDWLEAAGYDMDVVQALRESNMERKSNASTSLLKEQFGEMEYETNMIMSGLPAGAVKTVEKGYEKVVIPAKMQKPLTKDELVPITRMDPFTYSVFEGITHFNRLQSKIFEVGYNSNQNLLVCAPTGAGKTNVAMMTILREVKTQLNPATGRVDAGTMKIIYVAPMKALAQEVVTRFSKRLKSLHIKVAELTGDMQMTKAQIEETHIIVTTPEKWDVITRKTHEQALLSQVKLLIIDEVHLLADERGPVIETIVARTLRRVESTQTMIRIVGLSATLPNYKDVAEFLRVSFPANAESGGGLFHFDASYRPVPLEQTFMGITDKGRTKQLMAMNQLAYEYAVDNLTRGHQVMIFVHSRKETAMTIRAILDLAAKNGTIDLFAPSETPVKDALAFTLDGLLAKSRNKEVQEFAPNGCGIHHAGMLRSDRNLTEQLFENGQLKVLCCTATLAWGVNLPAHAVLIKGTQIYNAEKGCMVPLSMLDVMQIFGRAGRPQYDTSGEATIVTTHDQLDHYLRALSNQAPIESALIKTLPDHLNAEIVSGTVANMSEALTWLSYTYLFIRMMKSPMNYGMSYDERANDPMLVQKRTSLLKQAIQTLEDARMIKFDQRRGDFAVTNLGRVASHYYITHGTIETFNEMLSQYMEDEDVLHVICSSSEFEQVQVREDETVELEKVKKSCKLPIKGDNASSGKANVLLQAYISNTSSKLTNFTLISDTNYVAQNGSRVTRALFEICLKKGWPVAAEKVLNIAKSIDHRMWWTQSPLRRFLNVLPFDAVARLEERYDIDTLFGMSVDEIGVAVRSPRVAEKVVQYLKYLPYLAVEVHVQPLTQGILKLTVDFACDFEWNDQYHGSVESWWLWVEDSSAMYHAEHVLVHKAQRLDMMQCTFHVPMFQGTTPEYTLRLLSDRWVGVDSTHAVVIPDVEAPESVYYTPLLRLQPLPVSALKQPAFEELYSFPFFNPIQTQLFHHLYHTNGNVLLGAPTGSGKTIVAELAMLRLWTVQEQHSIVVYVAPLKALARERVKDWTRKFERTLGKQVVELTGDTTVETRILKQASIIVTTPEKWDLVTRNISPTSFVHNVRLVLMDEVHLLGEDRGPVLEAIVSRMRMLKHPTRLVGLSTALANAMDVGRWMGITDPERGIFNFRASVRPISMDVHLQGFAGRHYCPRMTAMNKPTYHAIATYSPKKPALVFVSSRSQTRLTAMALVSFAALAGTPKQFLWEDEEIMATWVDQVRDPALKDSLLFGIGLHHAGLGPRDRDIVEELFLNNKIQVVICTSTLAWGVNLPAHLVVVKGTEFYDPKQGRYADYPMSDILQMIGRAGRPQFDTSGVACVFVQDVKQNFIKRFIYEPLPVESSLHLHLDNTLNAEICNGTIKSLSDAVMYLSWTFLFQRVQQNPAYYQIDTTVEDFFKKLVSSILQRLVQHQCCTLVKGTVTPTALGKIASAQYLECRTVHHLHTSLQALADDNVSTFALLRIVAGCDEFAQLPIRPQEERIVRGLAQQCRYQERTFKWDSHSSQLKCLLLLQMHLGQIALPSSDFWNDLRLVLDQLPRVLGAMMDLSALQGRASLVLAINQLCQGVLYGYWPHATGWWQLPHVTSDELAAFPVFESLDQVKAVLPRRLSEKQRQECMAIVDRMPRLSWSVAKHPPKANTMVVTVQVHNAKLQSLISNRWTKPRPHMLYVLVVGDDDKLVAMVHLPYRKTTTRTITLPAGVDATKVAVQLVSNCNMVKVV
ncbi:Aste57867_21101 [Aphanomyces stellatus]|uniref:Aste57867_21101 protein n=1 Tax=Aphanomyces stellatus TaxID=120398 RepID=A0A485LGN1_9STRA|nr:hypothetical protein As57867_021033 [Aphanomyces stellatus]VFT97775.1 Aste57867_21101 [Aphanomyces stellatus]